jgi:hypothetical protein
MNYSRGHRESCVFNTVGADSSAGMEDRDGEDYKDASMEQGRHPYA